MRETLILGAFYRQIATVKKRDQAHRSHFKLVTRSEPHLSCPALVLRLPPFTPPSSDRQPLLPNPPSPLICTFFFVEKIKAIKRTHTMLLAPICSASPLVPLVEGTVLLTRAALAPACRPQTLSPTQGHRSSIIPSSSPIISLSHLTDHFHHTQIFRYWSYLLKNFLPCLS